MKGKKPVQVNLLESWTRGLSRKTQLQESYFPLNLETEKLGLPWTENRGRANLDNTEWKDLHKDCKSEENLSIRILSK